MRDIYASAAQVIIWLGEGDEESDLTFDALPVIADNGSFFLTLVDRRAWFNRVWILQELAMARNDPIVICGWKHAPWSTFFAAWNLIADDLLAPLGIRPQTFDAGSDDSDAGPRTERLSLTKLDILNSLRQTIQTRGGENHRRLLMISRASEATDPRDRIYGLLGLLDGDSTDPTKCFVINVDYRRDCSEVYADAMAHFFSKGEGLDFLSGLFLPGATSAVPAIPSFPSFPSNNDRRYLSSWVPDFSRQIAGKAAHPTSMAFRPPTTMSASGVGQDAKNGKVLEDRLTQQVEGLVVNTIDNIVPFGSSIDAVIDKVQGKRTALAHTRFQHEQDHMAGIHSDNRDRPAFKISLRSCIGLKSFFTTKSGFVGTCIPSACEGDIIAIIFGSPAAFVLRSITRIEGQQQAYSLIGAAYIGGVMDGKMVDELYCKDLMDSTTFFIR
ncbi:hypothetical protein EK21DRAFT_105355 [Setomelanomma holmii]|uniref:Heterokaryon incompatibility domain-containing protein n=1 Tax=Setomelanomma holmii TaxID=210430 RepID=A0A9P4GXN4_9PLEO|nr:hypothetical protein EK21DRAFT_105355 [Setomelanomma holmii]